MHEGMDGEQLGLDRVDDLLLGRLAIQVVVGGIARVLPGAREQQIVNSIKSQLLTVHTFVHLPWAAWDAPGVIQTDMGGLSLMQLFIASEIGGSAPPKLLHETGSTYNGEDVLLANPVGVASSVRRLMTGR
jgi:hypothetical protein